MDTPKQQKLRGQLSGEIDQLYKRNSLLKRKSLRGLSIAELLELKNEIRKTPPEDDLLNIFTLKKGKEIKKLKKKKEKKPYVGTTEYKITLDENMFEN